MQTIAECLPVYGTTIARNHAKKLWSALKIEVSSSKALRLEVIFTIRPDLSTY